jgi:hypothetical protein
VAAVVADEEAGPLPPLARRALLVLAAELQAFGERIKAAEVAVHVGFNTLTNYVNEALGTPIDFPRVDPATRAA